MKRIEYKARHKHPQTNEDVIIKINVYEVGDEVWVARYLPMGRYKEALQPYKLKVSGQEWWDGNDHHPVYYDLIDPIDDQVVGVSGSGNWHCGDVFETEKQAVNDIIKWFSCDIKYYEECLAKGEKLIRNEIRRFNKFKKQLLVWQKRMKEIEND